MRTTIRLNSELARRAKEYAASNHKTFTDVVEEAVTKLLSQSRAPRKRRKKIVLPTAGDPKRRITHGQYRANVERMYEEEAAAILQGHK